MKSFKESRKSRKIQKIQKKSKKSEKNQKKSKQIFASYTQTMSDQPLAINKREQFDSACDFLIAKDEIGLWHLDLAELIFHFLTIFRLA